MRRKRSEERGVFRGWRLAVLIGGCIAVLGIVTGAVVLAVSSIRKLPSGPPARAVARDLVSAFRENAPRFKEQWVGRWVEIEDKVDSVRDKSWEPGFGSQSFVFLDSGACCLFADSTIPPRLNRGQSITLIGLVGLVNSDRVILRDCRLKFPLPAQ